MKKIVTLCISLYLSCTVAATDSLAQEAADQKVLMMNTLDWSPDGDHLLFTAIMVKRDFSDFAIDNWGLYQFELNTKTVTKLGNGVLFASYAPSGKEIAYGMQVDKNWDIYLKSLSGGEAKRLTSHPETDNAPAWSPDGSKIAFNSERSGGKEIFIMDADGNNIRQITHSEVDTMHSYNPQWSPDGSRIVYFLEKGDGMDQVYQTDTKGSFFKNLTNNNKHNFYPTWTPDSEILYTVGSEKKQIYIMNADGSDNRAVAGLKGSYAKQSPVHDVITAIVEGSEGNREIILYDISTGTAESTVTKSIIQKIK